MFYWYALLYTPSSQQWLDLLWEFLMELSKMQMPQWSDSSPTVLLLMLGLIPIIYHCLPRALIWVYAFPCCEVLAVDQLTVALCGGAGAVNKAVVVNSYSGSCKPLVRLSNPLVDYQDHSLVVIACYQWPVQRPQNNIKICNHTGMQKCNTTQIMFLLSRPQIWKLVHQPVSLSLVTWEKASAWKQRDVTI